MSGMTDMSSTGANGTMAMKMYFHGSIGTDMLWFESWMPTSTGATVGVCIGVFLLAIFERYLVAFRRACDAGWRKGQIGFIRPTSSSPYISSSDTSYSSLPPSQTPAERRSSTQKAPVDPKNPYESLTTSNYNSNSPPDPDIIPTLPDSPYTPSTGNGKSTDISTVPLYTAGTSSSETSASDEKVRPNNTINSNTHSHLPKAVQRGLDPYRHSRWSRPFRWSVDLPRGLLQALQTFLHYLLMLVVMTFQIWWIIAVVVGAGVGEMLFGRFGVGGNGH